MFNTDKECKKSLYFKEQHSVNLSCFSVQTVVGKHRGDLFTTPGPKSPLTSELTPSTLSTGSKQETGTQLQS